MKNIGIVIKLTNPEAEKLGAEIAAWLHKLDSGIGVFGDRELGRRVSAIKGLGAREFSEKVEAVIVLGGDGTMLGAVRMLAGKRAPILGINMGGLGFLTTLTTKNVYKHLKKILKGDFETDERMLLRATLSRDGRCVSEYLVLNDVVIKATIARLVKLETRINDEYITTYRADGLIIATPTGSTAYSLSALGPILYPTIHSIILAPVCPFNLTNRPVVIPDWMGVEIKLVSDHSRAELTLDGQVDVELKTDDVVSVKRAANESVLLIKGGVRSYFDILRERLMWEPK